MNAKASNRPVILIFMRYYLPGYKAGGPLRTISNMVEALGREFDFRIVTSDRDAGDTNPYPGLEEGEWKKVGKSHVLYLSPDRRAFKDIVRVIRQTPHDVLYLNSFFDPIFTQKPLVARRLGLVPRSRCILAPRGEFSQGALSLKPAKKKTFFLAARAVGLHRGLEWHASSKLEEADIRRALNVSDRQVRIAINLPSVTQRPRPFVPRALGQPLRVVFLSRISRMKNLDFALRVLSRVNKPVAFSVYGPSEDTAYEAECQKLARQLPPHIRVGWHGPVDPDEVRNIIADHDLFFLPTRGENFGHVIAEALSAGTPVLLSDVTPWRGLTELGIGDDLPLGAPAEFVSVIERAAGQSAEAAATQRALALSYAWKRRQNTADLEANRLLFRGD